MAEPLVSIALITYKHEKYIHRAMEGILSQKGIENYEIVVGDDVSPDKTKEIMEDYSRSNPNIRFVKRDKNVGMHRNWLETIQACKGKYIALIEGDDYWTDPLKLQKQVALLEADDGLSLCFTDVEVINEMNDGVVYGTYLEHQDIDLNRSVFNSKDLCDQNFISTVSVLMRNQKNWVLNKDYFQSPYVDWIFLIIKSLQGNLGYIADVTAAYRIHESGAFGYSDIVLRKSNNIKVLRCIYSNLPECPEKQYVFNRFLLAIEEYAQLLKGKAGKATGKFYRLKTIRKLAEMVNRPIFTHLID